MNTFNAKHLTGLCMNRMVVDDHLAEQLEIAFSLLINEGLICKPKPQEEAPEIPTLDAVKEVVESLEDCSTNEIVEIVYDLATGAKSIADYETWRVSLRLYIDDDKYDYDSSEFSQAELATGQIGLGDFALDCPTSAIEFRVNDFINDSISSWNGEDDAEFDNTWYLECDFGCTHEVRAEIEIERI